LAAGDEPEITANLAAATPSSRVSCFGGPKLPTDHEPGVVDTLAAETPSSRGARRAPWRSRVFAWLGSAWIASLQSQ